MRVVSVLMLLLASSKAFSAQTLACTHYVYADIPFATITMKLTADGHIERLADLTHFGVTKQTAVEENPVGEGQLYNLTVEADTPDGELFLEIYKPSMDLAVNSFKAKLINPKSPAGKEMAGQCDLTEN